jgi:hypothetical protein
VDYREGLPGRCHGHKARAKEGEHFPDTSGIGSSMEVVLMLSGELNLPSREQVTRGWRRDPPSPRTLSPIPKSL